MGSWRSGRGKSAEVLESCNSNNLTLSGVLFKKCREKNIPSQWIDSWHSLFYTIAGIYANPMESIALKIQPRIAKNEETFGCFFFEVIVDA
jgi:hypothetical protein